jgi:bifunctional non-homologous end joining protein LigD
VPKEDATELLSIDGREVRVTNSSKLYSSKQTKLSKLDLVRYYLSVAPGALAGIRDRLLVLKRYVNGAEGEAFYQKRAPAQRPSWLRTITLAFPSGRTAEEIVVDDAAGLAWIVNLGCIELHPHPVRSGDLDHPDELRVDLDPGPGVSWADVRTVALEVKSLLDEMGLRGWPKTSGSRGMHINVRIYPRWAFDEVRRAALALSRAAERRGELPKHTVRNRMPCSTKVGALSGESAPLTSDGAHSQSYSYEASTDAFCSDNPDPERTGHFPRPVFLHWRRGNCRSI